MQVLASQKQSGKDNKNNSSVQNQKTNDSEYRRSMTFAHAESGVKKKSTKSSNGINDFPQNPIHYFNRIPLFHELPMFIQPKLNFGQPNDSYEEEADEIAEKIVHSNDSDLIQRNLKNSEEEEIYHPKSLASRITPIKNLQAQPGIKDEAGLKQKKAEMDAPAGTSSFYGRLIGNQNDGSPLPPEINRLMSHSFGTDFSHVRIHYNSNSFQMNRNLLAKAFTHGPNIYFNQGKYRPWTKEGQLLLAHELTHTIQQNSGRHHSHVIQKKGEDEEMRSYPVKIPPGITSEFELDRYAEVLIFGREINITWENLNLNVAQMVGKTINYKYSTHLIKKHGGKNNATPPPAKNKAYDELEQKKRTEIDAEIYQRFWGETHYPEGEMINKGEAAKTNMWNVYRDQVVAEHQRVQEIPEQIRKFLEGGQNELKASDYKQILRIYDKLTPSQWEDYMNRVNASTDDLDKLEESVQKFKKKLEERKEERVKRDFIVTKLNGLEDVYRLYKKFQKNKHLKYGDIIDMPGGGTRFEPPTEETVKWINDMEQQILDALKRNGIDSIPEFEKFMRDYETGFRTETVAIANDMLDYYEHLLYNEEKKYRDDMNVDALYNQLGGIRSRYKAVENINSELSEIYKERNKRRTPNDFTNKEPPKEKKRREELEAEGKAHVEAAKEEAGRISVTDPLMREDYLPLNKRLNKTELAKADRDELKKLLLKHIGDRRKDIRETRQNLAEDSLRIYALDKLMTASYNNQRIKKDSIYDLIITEKQDLERNKHIVEAIVVAIIAIAAGILTFGGGTVGVLAALGAFSLSSFQAYQEFREYEFKTAAAGSTLLSDDPSMIWVIIAVAGAGLDMTAVASSLKAIKPAVQALELTGDAAKFDEALKLMAKEGNIEQKIAQRVIEANKTREAANEAAREFFQTISGKIYSGGPFTDPDVYPHLLKYAVSKVNEGIQDFLVFVEKIKLARIEAKLGEMTPEELAQVKKAWLDANKIKTLAGEAEIAGQTSATAAKFSNKTIDELRNLAKSDPDAAFALIERYKTFSLSQLRKLAKGKDGTASQVIDEYMSMTTPKLVDKALGGDKLAEDVLKVIWPKAKRLDKAISSVLKNKEMTQTLGEDLAKARKGTGVSRVEPLPTQSGAVEGGTVAVSRTDIDKLSGKLFEGGSPNTGSPANKRYKPSNPTAVDHAEQTVFGNIADEIDKLKLTPDDLEGKTIFMRVEQSVCSSCRAGIHGAVDHLGVIMQFSNEYPKVLIEITTTESPEVIRILGGARIR